MSRRRIGFYQLFIQGAFGKALNDAPATFADKGYYFIALIVYGQFFFYELQRLRGVHAFVVNAAVHIQYLVDLLVGKTPAFEANAVYPGIAKRRAACFYVWWYIFAHQRAAGNKCMLPNVYVLVHRAYPTNHSPVAHYYVPGHLGIIAHNAVVAYNAVVGYVAIGHYQAVVAHLGFATVYGTPVDGYKLADGAVVAYFHQGFFAGILQILRYGGNNRTGKDAAVFAYASPFHNGYIAAYPGAFANGYIAMHYGKGVNLYIVGQAGIGMYIRQWVNHNLAKMI
jgi:hypothetical protein